MNKLAEDRKEIITMADESRSALLAMKRGERVD
jgi:hypothetical protein